MVSGQQPRARKSTWEGPEGGKVIECQFDYLENIDSHITDLVNHLEKVNIGT